MITKIKKWFSKDQDKQDYLVHPSHIESMKFILKLENLDIGTLKYDVDHWVFQYTNEFKKQLDKYNRIIGFPDVDEIYTSKELWPFFQIRIPGLKQPAIRDILVKEDINPYNEAALLKRFGYKSISNPYKLIPV